MLLEFQDLVSSVLFHFIFPGGFWGEGGHSHEGGFLFVCLLFFFFFFLFFLRQLPRFSSDILCGGCIPMAEVFVRGV